MPGVAVPARKQGGGLLDTVMKGLQIAQGVYGIKADAARIEQMDALERRRLEQEGESKKAKDFAAAGGKTQGEYQAGLLKGEFEEVAPGTPGGLTIPVQGADGTIFDKVIARASQPKIAPPDPMAEKRFQFEQEKFAYQKQKDSADRDAKQKAISSETRVKPLNAEERKRLDSASMGLAAIRDMGGALAAGTNTFSVVGDNDFTAARARFEEALGRMQSGGAINNEEAKRFAKMAPTFTDSAEMQAKKMDELYREMALRIQRLGADPDEILAQREAIKTPEFAPAGGPGKALAAPTVKPAAEMSDAELDAELARLKGGKK